MEDYIKFETPFRRSEFVGTTVNRQTVTIRKTDNCLISLVEGPPFFVLSLEEIELCVLERVILGQKAFDMVFINKDYTKPVQRVDAIEMKKLDELKDWLTEKGLKYYECRQPLAWGQIMKEVTSDDQKGLWNPWSETEGWASFLDMDRQSSDESDTEQDDEAFDPEDMEGDDESDESYSESDETTDEDASVEQDSEEDSGMDWDEMEAQAAAEDKQRNASGSDSDERVTKRRAVPKRAPVARAGGRTGRGGRAAPMRTSNMARGPVPSPVARSPIPGRGPSVMGRGPTPTTNGRGPAPSTGRSIPGRGLPTRAPSKPNPLRPSQPTRPS
eukprot:NODE_4038_length_1240_cov_38.157565_g3548_i0.p1 GENE.NODE_4038_length_1240_cov_38.157565_g3548_i0~~NODE_4038_length_1240_cov_38.157565_g3548_i0.p1  ORF type:complete len:384 (+),score=112.88 NODE_4038_length_1240_cov_38.157565_g3548_i0:166-1152(+)